MMNVTRWSPDTCGCSLEYEWDSESSEANRVHTFKAFLTICENHAGLNLDASHYLHVLQENQAKNRMLQLILVHVPRLKKLRTQDDGSVVEELDPTVTYDWHFTGKDHQRQLHVSIKGKSLTQAEKAALRTAAASL